MEYMKNKQAAQEAHPQPAGQRPLPSLIGQGASVIPARACRHRYWPDGHCVNCGTTHEEVNAMAQEKALKLAAAGR